MSDTLLTSVFRAPSSTFSTMTPAETFSLRRQLQTSSECLSEAPDEAMTSPRFAVNHLNCDDQRDSGDNDDTPSISISSCNTNEPLLTEHPTKPTVEMQLQELDGTEGIPQSVVRESNSSEERRSEVPAPIQSFRAMRRRMDSFLPKRVIAPASKHVTFCGGCDPKESKKHYGNTMHINTTTTSNTHWMSTSLRSEQSLMSLMSGVNNVVTASPNLLGKSLSRSHLDPHNSAAAADPSLTALSESYCTTLMELRKTGVLGSLLRSALAPQTTRESSRESDGVSEDLVDVLVEFSARTLAICEMMENCYQQKEDLQSSTIQTQHQRMSDGHHTHLSVASHAAHQKDSKGKALASSMGSSSRLPRHISRRKSIPIAQQWSRAASILSPALLPDGNPLNASGKNGGEAYGVSLSPAPEGVMGFAPRFLNCQASPTASALLHLHPNGPQNGYNNNNNTSMCSEAGISHFNLARSHRAQLRDDGGFELINDYMLLDEIGRGASGIVFLAIHQVTEKPVAIKSLPKERKSKAALPSAPSDDNIADLAVAPFNAKLTASPQGVEHEIHIMKRLKHSNIVRLLEVVDDDDECMIHLVMDYCPNGPVVKISAAPTPHEQRHSFIHQDNKTLYKYGGDDHQRIQFASFEELDSSLSNVESPPPERTQDAVTMLRSTVVRPVSRLVAFASQIALGLQYLHKSNVVHRDIKPDNILVAEDNATVKISDFGVSGRLVSKTRHSEDHGNLFSGAAFAGTPAFQAPEVLDESTQVHEVGKPADVWSMGVTLYLMMFGTLPFQGETLAETQRAIAQDEVTFPELSDVPEISPGELDEEHYSTWKDVIRLLLVKDSQHRLSLKHFLLHPFVVGLSNAPREQIRRSLATPRSSGAALETLDLLPSPPAASSRAPRLELDIHATMIPRDDLPPLAATSSALAHETPDNCSIVSSGSPLCPVLSTAPSSPCGASRFRRSSVIRASDSSDSPSIAAARSPNAATGGYDTDGSRSARRSSDDNDDTTDMSSTEVPLQQRTCQRLVFVSETKRKSVLAQLHAHHLPELMDDSGRAF